MVMLWKIVWIGSASFFELLALLVTRRIKLRLLAILDAPREKLVADEPPSRTCTKGLVSAFSSAVASLHTLPRIGNELVVRLPERLFSCFFSLSVFCLSFFFRWLSRAFLWCFRCRSPRTLSVLASLQFMFLFFGRQPLASINGKY